MSYEVQGSALANQIICDLVFKVGVLTLEKPSIRVAIHPTNIFNNALRDLLRAVEEHDPLDHYIVKNLVLLEAGSSQNYHFQVVIEKIGSQHIRTTSNETLTDRCVTG